MVKSFVVVGFVVGVVDAVFQQITERLCTRRPTLRLVSQTVVLRKV